MSDPMNPNDLQEGLKRAVAIANDIDRHGLNTDALSGLRELRLLRFLRLHLGLAAVDRGHNLADNGLQLAKHVESVLLGASPHLDRVAIRARPDLLALRLGQL